MTETFNLGGHRVNDLQAHMADFFTSKGMNAECGTGENGALIVNARSPREDFASRLFGSDCGCHVEVVDLGDGRVQVTAGKGLWAGKLTGAAIVIYVARNIPVIGLPLRIISAGVVAANAAKQAILPSQAIRAAAAYLTALKVNGALAQ